MKKVPVTKRYYEPIPEETHKAWLAFCAYRDYGAERSLDKVYRLVMGKGSGRHGRHWAGWSSRFHWVSRAEAFDVAVGKRKRRAVEEAEVERYARLFGEF